MGLDAAVYCDCYERGRARRPPQPDLTYVDQNGQVCLRWDAPDADQNAFLEWQKDRCNHGPLGELVSHRLGNIARVAYVRALLLGSAKEFPVLLTKVVYDGSHGGDWLALKDVEDVRGELSRLLERTDLRGEVILAEFCQQMEELVDAALRVHKPIAF